MHHKIVVFFSCILLLVPVPGRWTGAEEGEGYHSITGPCMLQFPEDHGDHPGFRTEWWYYTGNVQSDDGQRFGYQLTIFRRQISPSGAGKRWPSPASKWRTQQVFLGHLALSDISGKKYYFTETAARGAVGLAGAIQRDDTITIIVKNWSIRILPNTHRLQAGSNAFSLDLHLEPLKNPVLHGEQGYSRKGRTPERASCYYSFTRLATRGKISFKGQDVSVSGESWMDHEFSTAPLEKGTKGWEWFSLQLDNQTELMVYLLRREDGTLNPASSGTFINRHGTARHLTSKNFTVTTLDTWKSPRSGARYPARWKLNIPQLGMILTVVPNLADQEMHTPETTGVTYWEGSVSARGGVYNQPVKGQGYVELTGYAGRFDSPL